MKSVKDTTVGRNLITEVNVCMFKLGLIWHMLAGVTTKGCTYLTGRKLVF